MTAGPAVIAVCLVLGLFAGAFGAVAIDRVPDARPLRPLVTACRHCRAAVGLVPLWWWIRGRGRCPTCGVRADTERLAVELACGALFAAIAWRVGLSWALPGFLLFGWLLLVASVIDLHTLRIPNRLTYPLTPALLVLLVAAAFAERAPDIALRTVLGGVAAFAVLLLLALINPRGMGMGDVKLAGFIGLGLGYLGWAYVWLGLFLGFLGGGVIAGLLLLLRLRSRKDHIPFGPWLALGAIGALLAGRQIIDGYLRWAGLT